MAKQESTSKQDLEEIFKQCLNDQVPDMKFGGDGDDGEEVMEAFRAFLQKTKKFMRL